MSSRIVCLLCLILTAGMLQPSMGRPAPASLDSTDRETYEYDGPPVTFGFNPASAEIVVDETFDINDVDVTVDISHTWDGDVSLVLVSPEGTSVLLVDSRGGSGHDFHNTEFNDDAPEPISNGAPPFWGSFRPEEPLAEFNGESGIGTWTLLLQDNFPSLDDGLLNAWTMTLGGRIGGVVEGRVTSLATGAPLEGVTVEFSGTIYRVLSDGSGDFRLQAPEGTYDLRVGYAGWCEQTVLDIELSNMDTTEMDFELRNPSISLSRSSLNALVSQNSSETLELELANTGNCDMHWHGAYFVPWLILSAIDGDIPAEATDVLSVEFDTEDLEPGDYVTRLEIANSSIDSLVTIPIFLVVTHLAAEESPAALPTQAELLGNYPNPFNASTTIRYALPGASDVEFEVFSIEGRLAERISLGNKPAGFHSLGYDAARLPSGTYLVRMRAGEFTATSKMMLLK